MTNVLKDTNFNFPKQQSFYRGKVRDVYNIDGKYLAMVVSDRISAFDVVLPRAIPYKGQVLNQIAAKFLGATKDIVPNWVVTVPDPNVTVGLVCETYPVEMVVRGYLAGHAAREYKAGKRVLCGVTLPEGLKETINCQLRSLRLQLKQKKAMIWIYLVKKLLRRELFQNKNTNSWKSTHWHYIKEVLKWPLSVV